MCVDCNTMTVILYACLLNIPFWEMNKEWYLCVWVWVFLCICVAEQGVFSMTIYHSLGYFYQSKSVEQDILIFICEAGPTFGSESA